MYEELGSAGFVPFTVALDRCVDDVRPFVEAASPTHPSVIDTGHHIAELYNIVNVPTIIWIDEAGRICRPHDSQFGTDTFSAFHGRRSAPYLDLIRAWVRDGSGVLAPEDVRAQQLPPSAETQRARAERALGWWLTEQGQVEAGARHLALAADLAPKDWTIRRGSMPILGKDPFGPEFFALAGEGAPEYPMEAVTPTRDPDFDR